MDYNHIMQSAQLDDTSGSSRNEWENITSHRLLSLFLCSLSLYPRPTSSHLYHSHVFYHSHAPFMSPSRSLSLHPSVAKAIVFCGGSWLGLICQAADPPSLVLFSFSCTLFHFLPPCYSVCKKKKTEEPNCHTCMFQKKKIMWNKWTRHISERSSSLVMFTSVRLKWCVFFHVSNSLAVI